MPLERELSGASWEEPLDRAATLSRLYHTPVGYSTSMLEPERRIRSRNRPSSRAPNGRKTKELPVRVLFRRHLFRRE